MNPGISNLRHPCVVRIGKLREKLIAALREEELQPGRLQLLILEMESYEFSHLQPNLACDFCQNGIIKMFKCGVHAQIYVYIYIHQPEEKIAKQLDTVLKRFYFSIFFLVAIVLARNIMKYWKVKGRFESYRR
jgi:hypothetical protein